MEVKYARARGGFVLELDNQAVKPALCLKRSGEGCSLCLLKIFQLWLQLGCGHSTDRRDRQYDGRNAKMFELYFHFHFMFLVRGSLEIMACLEFIARLMLRMGSSGPSCMRRFSKVVLGRLLRPTTPTGWQTGSGGCQIGPGRVGARSGTHGYRGIRC